MQPLVLANGMYLRSTEFNVGSHLDSAHVMAMNAGKESVTDLGVIRPFITSGFLGLQPTLSFSGLGQNRIFSDSHIYKMSQPLTVKEFYVLELKSSGDKLGMGGETFKVKFNSRKYDNLWIITPDPQSGLDFLITTDEIVKDGDGWIFTLQLKGTNSNSRFVDAIYFQPGSKFYGKSTVHAEYSQTYSSIPEFDGGMRSYFNFVGQTSSQLHYSVTRDAAKATMSNHVTYALDQYREVIELYRFHPGTLGYNVSNLSPEQKMAYGNNAYSFYQAKYGGNAKDAMKADLVETKWIPKIEALTLATLQNLVHNEAWYGTGGKVHVDGKTTNNSSLGLFYQFNMGNTHIYNPYDFSLAKLETIVASLLVDRQEPYATEKVFVVKTGRGGYSLATTAISQLPAQMGLLMSATDTGIVQGFSANNNHLKVATPTYDSYRMRNGYGWLKFEIDPALDPVSANDITNPVLALSQQIGGSRLSSFIYIIEDLKGGLAGDNVREIVYKHDWDIRASVNQGKLAYMGAPTFNGGMWQRSSHHPGYEVFFEQNHKAYVLLDPSRSLIIKPVNPRTKKPIFSDMFG